MKPEFASLYRDKLTTLVVAQVKGLIFSKNIAVGEALPSERNLATQLDVSRSVVREALQSLELSGFIEIRRGSGGGSFVVDRLHKPLYNSIVDLMKSGRLDVRQFTEARVAIECYCLRLAMDRVQEKDLLKLEAINTADKETLSPASRVEHNESFHITIAELSGNSLLVLMLKSLLDILKEAPFRAPRRAAFFKKSKAGHEEIVESMRQKDWARCEKLLVENIQLTGLLKIKNPFKTTTAKTIQTTA